MTGLRELAFNMKGKIVTNKKGNTVVFMCTTKADPQLNVEFELLPNSVQVTLRVYVGASEFDVPKPSGNTKDEICLHIKTFEEYDTYNMKANRHFWSMMLTTMKQAYKNMIIKCAM